MIDKCTRCRRRLTGLFSTQIGMGPVCMRKSHRENVAADEARKAQPDLFQLELVEATYESRVQSLLARIEELTKRSHNHARMADQ